MDQESDRENNSIKSVEGEEQKDVSHVQQVNEQLYKRNVELAEKNKTLSVLKQLYEIITQTLAREELARKLTYSIRTTLNYEMASIIIFDQEEKLLEPIALSSSDTFQKHFEILEDKYSSMKIDLHEDQNVFVDVYASGVFQKQSDFSKLFSSYLDVEKLQDIQKNTGIKEILIFPLKLSDKKIGLFLISISRYYQDFSDFEKASLNSIMDVVSVALDKGQTYDELREANEKLMELDKAKSEFMSIASHQLRTPLAGISGYLSMMMEGDYGKLDPEQKPVLNDILQASQRLARIVNVFLNVTRIEAGRFVMNFSTAPFYDVIEGVYKELKPTADKKGVTLVIKKTTLPEVEADVDKMKDVILNLIDNAIKYTPEGTVTVSATANKRTVHVQVHDTGVGISPTEAKNLFSKFVRGSGIAQVQPDGSGLGLYIAKRVIEGHGGKIWVESEGEGKGSTFHFEIPIIADKESKSKTEEFQQRAKKE